MGPSINLNLNGINTQGENIADNGGIKEAYRAYERYTTRHGQEKTLPGLGHNVKQLFWLSAANTWCSKYRPKSLEKRIKTGAHSPGMFRVKGPFSNSKELPEISIVQWDLLITLSINARSGKKKKLHTQHSNIKKVYKNNN